ncbi:hypothetical protein MTO96_039984 [Rhipicephalus appendiculatus]
MTASTSVRDGRQLNEAEASASDCFLERRFYTANHPLVEASPPWGVLDNESPLYVSMGEISQYVRVPQGLPKNGEFLRRTFEG